MEIEVQQTVRLNKLSKVYLTFPSAFKSLGFENRTKNPQTPLKPHKGQFFKVFAVGKGKLENLVGIQNNDGVQILVERQGVTILKRT